MEERTAEEFDDKVHALLDDGNDREYLYKVLDDLQRTPNIRGFVSELRKIIDEPSKIPLYDVVRPLIPLKRQVEYDSYVPYKSNNRLHVVRLRRRTNESLGFAVRGGMEYGVGMYVSYVEAGGQADRLGLRVGDQIVRVNGFTIDQAIHEEVLSLIKSKSEIVLKVKSVGMIPVKDHNDDRVTWQYVDNMDSSKTVQHTQDIRTGKEVTLFFNLVGGMGLGCSICTGPPDNPGIFIQSVRKGSLADEALVEIGDQIMAVNDTPFNNLSHKEAVMSLKSSKQLEITIKKAAGIDLFRPLPPTLSAEEISEMERLRESKELAAKREREKQMKLEKERGLLQSEKKIEIAERKRLDEEKKNEEMIKQMKLEEEKRRLMEEEKERRDNLEKKKLKKELMETEERAADILRRQSDVHAMQMQKMQTELAQIKQREQLEKERLKEEEKMKEKQKRVQKENQLLEKISKQEAMLVRKEMDLRKERIDQEMEESKREEQRNTTQTPVAKRRSVELKHVPAEDRVVAPPRVDLQKQSSFILNKPVMLKPVSETKKKVLSEPMDESKFDPYRLFTNEQIAGRHITLVKMSKEDLSDLGVEGGTNSPLGKVVVADVFDGPLKDQGKIKRGDQLMMLNGHALLEVELGEAKRIIEETIAGDTEKVSLVIAKSEFLANEDEFTYL